MISRNLFNSGVHLIVMLIFHRLVTLKNEKDYFIILLLSFLLMISSGSVNPGLSFLILFFIFFFISVLFLTLLNLYKGNFRIKSRILANLFRIYIISTTMVFLASPAVFFAIPRLGIGFGAIVGSSPTLASGFSESVNLGDIGKIIENNKVVMRVQTSEDLPEDHLWRGKGFDYFDGNGWSSKLIVSRGKELKRKYHGKRVIANVNLEPSGTDIVFLPYNLEWVRGIRLVKEDANGTFISPFGSLTKRSYSVEFKEGSEKILPFEEIDLSSYVQLSEFNENFYALAKKIAGETKEPELLSIKIENHLKKEFKYSLNLSSSANPLEDFLLRRKEGHCEYFASAMAILLRHLGIPARVVNGFKRGDFNPAGGYYVVREKDAHSWVEVYIEGKGWMAFDPTPSFPVKFDRNIFTVLRDTWDLIQFWWDKNFVTFSPQRQITLYFEFYQFLRNTLYTIERLKKIIVITSVILVFSIIALFLKKKKKKLEEGEEELILERRKSHVRFYDKLLKILKSKGFSIYDHETPFEFLERIKENILEAEALFFITDSYYKVRYGGIKLKRDDKIKIELSLKELKEMR